MPPRRPAGLFLPAILMLACGIALFHRAFFLNETFVNRDLRTYYRAAKSLVAPLVKASGGIPLWNPYFASGQPFAANPEHEVFHPATGLFLVLPLEWAIRLEVILPTFAAALGMLFLLQTLGRSRSASVFGALTWGFGGYVLSMSCLLPCLLATAPLPFALAFIVRLARTGGAANVAGLAASFGLIGLVAEPTTLLAAPVLLLAAFLHGLREAKVPVTFRTVGRPLLLAGAAGLLAVGIAAAALLPAAALSRKTVRSGGLAESLATRWSTPPVRLIELVAPRALGHVENEDERWFWAASLYPGARFPFLLSIYSGVLAAVLGAFAMTRDFRHLLPWTAAAVLGFLLSIGERSPILHLARSILPPLAGSRFPEKFLLLTLFAWAVAASFGFDAVLFGRKGEERRVKGVLLTIAGLGGAVAFAALILDARSQGTVWISLGAPPAIARDLSRTIALDSASVALWSLLYARLLPGPGLSRRRATIALPLLAAADLVIAGLPLLRTSPIETEAAPPPFLKPILAARPDGPLFHLAAWTARDVPSSILAPPPMPSFWGLATAFEDDFDLTELVWSARATSLFWDAVNADPRLMPGLLARRGVAAVVRQRRAPEAGLEVLLPASRRPFASSAERIERVDGEAGWLAAVRGTNGPGLVGVALVDRSEGALPDVLSPAVVVVKNQTPVRLILEVTTAGPNPSFVVLNQTWDVGWSAICDGHPVRLVKTDVSLSGFVVPFGARSIELRYRDLMVERGLLVSLLAIGATALLGLSGLVRRVWAKANNP